MFTTQKINPATGEIVVTAPLMPPDPDAVKTLAAEVGDNPQVLNLRDNDWLDGKLIVIARVKFQPSNEYKTDDGSPRLWGFLLCWLIDDSGQPGKTPVIVMTGAENVISRVFMAQDQINNGTMLKATLRKAGRSWQLD